MAVVNPRKIYQSPFPRWYNSNTTCAYHGGVPGHSIEQCLAFKHKVKILIDAGWLTFQEDSPNVRTSPYAIHRGLLINAVEECGPRGLKQMEDVLTSRRFLLEVLCEVGMICLDVGKGDPCLIHPGASHNVEACSMVEDLLQGLMDKGLIKVCGARKEGEDVCMQSDDKSQSKPKKLVIDFTRDVSTQKPQGFQPIPVRKPISFPYRSDKAVPWRYATQGSDERKDASIVCTKDDQSTAKVTNISGTNDITRSGQVFTAPEPLVRSKDPKGKAKAGVEESDKASPILDEEVPTGRFAKEEEDFNKKGIFTKEANEFLRII